MLNEIFIVDKYRLFHIALFKHEYGMCYDIVKSLIIRLEEDKSIKLNKKIKEMIKKLNTMNEGDLNIQVLSYIRNRMQFYVSMPNIRIYNRNNKIRVVKSNDVTKLLQEYKEVLMYLMDEITVILHDTGFDMSKLHMDIPLDMDEFGKDIIKGVTK